MKSGMAGEREELGAAPGKIGLRFIGIVANGRVPIFAVAASFGGYGPRFPELLVS